MAVSFVSYFLASIFVAMGIVGGCLAARVAEDELKKGHVYFKEISRFLLIVILLFFVYSLNIYKLAQFLIFLVVISLYVMVKIKDIKFTMPGINWIYAGFGILFFLTTNKIVLGSLILIYGFPIGSLFYFKKKDKLKIVLPMILFIAVANIVYFVF